MIREGHTTNNFFVGKEVEHTAAHGLETLFVIGIQPISEISFQLVHASKNPIKHIFFGANQSFRPDEDDPWENWETMINYFLKTGLWCSLDMDIKHVAGLHESMLCESNSFIPMISAKVPNIRLLNYNAVLKIDDVDFEHSNPGVWCHKLHSLQTPETFTHWSKYKEDKVI